MELFFKKYFWTVNLLFLFLVSLLAARTVNLVVEAAVAPAPSGGAVRATRGPAPQAPPAQLNGDALARVTGLPLPKPLARATEPTFDPNADPVKTSLPLKLLGTLVAADAQWSVASVLDTSASKPGTYMVGDTVMGAEVLAIERARVVIRNNGHKEYIDDNAGGGAPPPLAAGPMVREPGSNVTGDGIRAVSENDYQVPRSEVDKTLSNLNDVAMQARIVPAFKDGVSEGFKLFSIRPDSIYSKIGIQNGDVIKRINGYDMNSPEKALEVYSKLKDATRIEIDLDRNGSTVHKTYNIH